MSTATTATITIYGYPNGVDNTQRLQVVRGTIALVPFSLYPSDGVPLNWGLEQVKALPASSTTGPFPVDVDFKSVANPPSGYLYFWDSTTGNLHIFEVGSAGPLMELAPNQELPAAIGTDVIRFRASFNRN